MEMNRDYVNKNQLTEDQIDQIRSYLDVPNETLNHIISSLPSVSDPVEYIRSNFGNDDEAFARQLQEQEWNTTYRDPRKFPPSAHSENEDEGFARQLQEQEWNITYRDPRKFPSPNHNQRPGIVPGDIPLRRYEYPLRRSENPLRGSEHPLRRSEYPLRESEYSLRRSEYPLRESEYSLRRSEYPLRESEYSLRENEYSLRGSEYPMRRRENPRILNGNPEDLYDFPVVSNDDSSSSVESGNRWYFEDHQDIHNSWKPADFEPYEEIKEEVLRDRFFNPVFHPSPTDHSNIHNFSSRMDGPEDDMSYERLLELDRSIFDIGKGMSEEEISLIPEVLYDNFQNQKSCSICQCDFEQGERVSLITCFHLFHKECIRNWLLRRKHCPVCLYKV